VAWRAGVAGKAAKHAQGRFVGWGYGRFEIPGAGPAGMLHQPCQHPPADSPAPVAATDSDLPHEDRVVATRRRESDYRPGKTVIVAGDDARVAEEIGEE
jgi:hypothetical protein